MSRALVFLLSLFVSVAAFAQDYAVEITQDKKIIHIDCLSLPGNTTVESLLQLFPELICRGNTLFYNYDIQYDGKSVGDGRDVILVQTNIEELSKIEISDSSVSTQQKNGQSGVINLVPAALDRGLAGEGRLSVSTEPDVMGGLNLDYGGKKLDVRAHANVEYYRPVEQSVSTFESSDVKINQTDIRDARFLQETVSLNLVYHITGKDELKYWLIESSNDMGSTNFSDAGLDFDFSSTMGKGWYRHFQLRDTTEASKRALIVNSNLQYKHTFGTDHEFESSIGYNYGLTRASAGNNSPRTLDGEIKYLRPLFRTASGLVTLKIGANMAYESVDNFMMERKSRYLSPFAEFKYNGPKLKALAAFRYQHYYREFFGAGGNLSSSLEKDLIGNVSALWQVEPHHAIRVTAARNLVRPSEEMLYPVANNGSKGIIYGNPDLQRAYNHSAALTYITDHVTPGGHSFIFNSGIGYNRADGLFEERQYKNDVDDVFYSTYVNSGINNILFGDISLIYSYKIMTLSFAGNVFSNNMQGNGVRDRYTYFNLSIAPTFKFRWDWILSGKIIYNSAVTRLESRLGDCIYADLRLDKKLGDWVLSASIRDIFDYLTTDYTFAPAGTVAKAYDLYRRSFEVGCSYKFGRARR